MRRVYIYGLWTDGCRFVAKNRLRFLLTLLAAGIVCFIGIWNAFSVTYTEFPRIEHYNVILLIVGERGFFTYLLFRFLMSLAVLMLIALCGIRPILAWLVVIPILFYSYLSANFVGAIFIVAKLSVLPLMLVCLIPCFLITLFVFVFFSVQTVCSCALRLRYCRFFDFVLDMKTPFLFAAAACFAVALVESALATILTIGIVF